MLKLLFWGALIYIVYRYFQMKAHLKAGNKNEELHNRRQPPGNGKTEEKGDYIDYEEIK